ncbi:hypothetical protein GCM10010399_44270 [Dactylosporangium fulvum]|uniref:Uncharacterized protein n=1 Tax=Dactylosporangium fulvum TaxID=53359 RepID=A0ABY5W967_9ACTN|nr:hypothetical protein [Dactylosporangium fulvum]UWP85905.1 hypothetical protein Dfulv_17300 [Dactylosporangium fulvum]
MPDQPTLAPPDALRAAADAADDAICRRLDHNQVIALVADAVWRLAYERGHTDGHREADAAVQRPCQLAYERGRREATEGWERQLRWRLADGSTWEFPHESYVAAYVKVQRRMERQYGYAPGELQQRPVGSWETAEQPAPAPVVDIRPDPRMHGHTPGLPPFLTGCPECVAKLAAEQSEGSDRNA